MTKYSCSLFSSLLLLMFFLPGIRIINATGQDAAVSVISYKVEPGNTWSGLARKFHVSVKDLQSINPEIKDLKTGKIIRVPGSTQQAGVQTNAVPSKKETVYHTVKSGETLYRISKEYNVSVDDIKKWNSLPDNNIPLGKKLIVGYSTQEAKDDAQAKTVQPKKENPVVISKPDSISKPVSENTDAATKTIKADNTPLAPGDVEKITETGVAMWFNDQELNQTKFYALHRTAPIGTIIKVTNRMNNNSVFVKVVGALPDTGDNQNIIIKITSAAAQRIGAIDQRFTAELNYGITH